MRVLDDSAVLDRKQLGEITFNDAALMRDLLCALLDDTSRQMGLMGAAIREHDHKQAMRLAHSCKGACVNMGANATAAALRRLEQQASQEAFEDCAATMADLTLELERLRAEVEACGGDLPGRPQ